jgi:putative ABC transport system permease protein
LQLFMPFDDFVANLRHAARGLWRDRATSVAAVLILATATAATTSMFALVRGILLRPLPVRAQDRLIVSWKDLPSAAYAHHPFGDREIDAVARASRLLEAVGGVDANGGGRGLVVEAGHASYVTSAFVAGRFFEVLGVDPLLGRALRAEDDVDGAEPVTVITRGLWQRRYAASPLVLGRRIQIQQQTFTIVGVMPDLDLPRGVELWRTTHSTSTTGPFGDAARREIDLVGRLKPGVTLEQARSELASLTTELERSAPPGSMRGLVPVVLPLRTAIVGDVQPAIVALMAAVGLVLLIASANVANLLLLRGESRGLELAVRAALGASRGRIVAQVLTESVVLTLTAGIAGVALSWWTLGALVANLPGDLPRVDTISIDGVVIATVTFGIGLAAVIAGVLPAWLLAKGDLAGPLRGSGRGLLGGPGRRTRRALVALQVSLAVAIVAAAGLLVRTVVHLQSIEIGYASDALVLIELSLPQERYGPRARHEQFLEQAIAELATIPGIPAATPVNNGPFSHSWDVPRFTVEGQTAERAAGNPALNLESIFPNYFATLQIGMVRGRAFDDGDRTGAQLVAIVSDDVAERMWPGGTAIGKRLKMGGPDPREPWLTVVGVARSTRYRTLDTAYPTLYLPAAQFQMTAEMLVLRVTTPFDRVAATARARIAAIDGDVRVVQIMPFARFLDRPLAQPRFQAWLSGGFGLTAFMLTAVGLYAVIAASVRQRNRELALRVAIGADAGDLRRLVLGEAIRLAGLGVIAGLLLAGLAGRWVSGLLSGVSPLDPPTLAGAAVLLMAAAVAAAYVPMRRAARVDAGVLLRE